MLPDEKRDPNHATGNSQGNQDLQHERKIVPYVWVTLHGHLRL
jgi:hypothetical protein